MGEFPFFRRAEPLDPNRRPRLEYREHADDEFSGGYVFVDVNGGEWAVLDLAGGDDWPIEDCGLSDRVSRWTQHRLFVLLPMAIHARVYHFTRRERRGYDAFSAAHLDAQWHRALTVDLPVAPDPRPLR